MLEKDFMFSMSLVDGVYASKHVSKGEEKCWSHFVRGLTAAKGELYVMVIYRSTGEIVNKSISFSEKFSENHHPL